MSSSSIFLPAWIDAPTLIAAGAVLLILSSSLVSLLVSAIHKMILTLHLRYLLWRQQQKQNHDDDSTVVGTVSGVYIHPVKSMRAISLDESKLDNKGLVNDRRFMVVYEVPLPAYKKQWDIKRDTKYRFLTQRQCPSLATITASLNTNNSDDILTLEVAVAASSQKKETLRRIEIPLNMAPKQSNTTSSSSHFLAGIWDDTILVQDMGDTAAAFLQAIVDADPQSSLGGNNNNNKSTKVRLVRHSINDRAADPTFTPTYAKTWWGSTPLVSLTDGYPILVASEASLQQVNDKLQAAGKKDTIIPMSRFRPNVVIKGVHEAFDEDRWKVIAIGDVLFAVVKACPRCKQSCTDQTTGQVTDEPVGILKTFRALGGNGDGEASSSDDVFFAQNAIPLLGPGTTKASIKVGDPVRVLQRGDPIYK